MKAVIIDDEKDSREILANYISKYCPDIVVCGFGESVETGLRAIKEHEPQIVFLDIEMPYGNGFDLLERARDYSFETIFVTAFDHYAMQALNQSAAYYLLKPIDIDELIKAENYTQHSKVLLNNLNAGAKSSQKIMLPTLEGFEIVDIQSIVYCEAEDNFTKFFFEHGKPLLICRTLKYFEEILAGFGFIRIHRSHLINPGFVIRYSKGKGGYVTMKNEKELEVSSNKKKEFLDAFNR
jgi:two-component system, LytTR family, response regulator